MNTALAPNASPPAAQTDMGPLAWLLDQISDNLQAARAAVKRAVQQRGDGILSQPGADVASLRSAHAQVHQAAGAIELLGFFGAARLMQAAESALDQLADHPEQLDAGVLQRFESGFNALVDYLEAQRAGKNEPALKLYPQYRGLLELARADRIHPADLWDHEWSWPQVPPEPDAQPLQQTDRSEYEQALLQVLRGREADAAIAQLEAVAKRAQQSSAGPTASLWWLARGMLEALGAGLLPVDPEIKRLLNRLNLQLRGQLVGQSPAPRRLGHDLTFFCAQALHADATAARRPTPLLHTIDEQLELTAAPFADYRQSHFGLIDPAIVQQARKRAQALREGWSALAGHAQTHVDATRMARLIELAQGLRQPLQALARGSEVLAESLAGLFRKIGQRPDLLTPERALDVATAILFLEISLGHFRPEEQRFLERTQILARRIEQSAEGLTPDPLESWMEDLFRQASETQTMGSVVHELRADMNSVEKLLDAYFRNPAEKAELAQVPRLLSQMRGVFSVLGVDAASDALGALRDDIDGMLADGAPQPDQAGFDALASNIGVLGFLVDMLAYQPELAKSLFVFDREHKQLRAVVASAPRTAPPTPKQDVDQSAADLAREIAQGLAPEQAEQRLAQLRAEAEIAGVPDPTQQLIRVGTTTGEPQAASPVEAALPAQPAAADIVPADEPQDDLTEIFLEEAHEVIAAGREQTAHLHSQPHDANAMASLRRAFHTLKGSSRMVGLRDYGEAAWAMEQVFNRRIADQQAASSELLELAAYALDALDAWAGAIASGDASAHSSADLQARAAAFEGGTPLAAAPTIPATEPAAAPLPELPEIASIPAAPPAAPAAASEPQATPEPVDFVADLDALLLGLPEGTAPQPPAVPAEVEPADAVAVPAADTAEAPRETAGEADFTLPGFDALLQGIDLELPEPTPAEVVDRIEPPTEPAPTVPEISPPVEEPEPLPAIAVPDEVIPVDAIEPDALATAPAEAPQPPVLPEDEGYKVIGDLRIPTPLYNIYLAEADDLSRQLTIEVHAWLDEPTQPVSEYAVTAAHKLAGSSATVGLQAVAELASHVEHALDALRERADAAGPPPGFELLGQAAADIKQLLHQFAAGLLRPAPAGLLAGLAELANAAQTGVAATPAEPVSVAPAPPAAAGQPTIEAMPAPEQAIAPVEVEPLAALAFEPVAQAADAAASAPAPETGPSVEPAPLAESAILASAAEPAPPAVELPVAVAPQPEPVIVESPVAEPPPAATRIEPPAAPPPRPAAAPSGDLVDAIDPDLFPIFEEEANELLPALATSLRQWELHPLDTDSAASAMRTLHTLKGSARMAGAMYLGDMAHSLESDIDGLVSNPPVNADDLAELLGRFDHITTRFDRLRDAAQRGESRLLDSPAHAPEPAEPVAPTPTIAPALPEAELATTPAVSVPIEITPPLASVPAPLVAEPHARPAASRISAQAVRVRAALLDRLVNQAGEISISRSRLESEFESLRGSAGDLADNLDRLRQQVREIEIQAEAQMTARVQAARDEHRDFDPLEFDRFTRAQELTRMMAESVNDIGMVQSTITRLLRDIDDDMTRQARQTRDLQHDLLRTRMVEFDSLSERLYRTVRQAAKDLDKSVRLDIQGANIEIDRGVLDRMAGSFDHLLRNAVAHGIEPADERLAKGKPATGTISLALRQDGNEVVITLADDGRGLDYAAIRAKAEKLGLLAAGEPATEAALTELVFLPNFSSAEQTTAVAGRGVGLDVVRTDVNALGGRVLLDSRPGQGARFTLLLPLTTAITHVVLLRTGEKVYAVPANLVEIVLRYRPEQIAAAAQSLSTEYAGATLPFYWLGALLGESGRSTDPFGRTVPVIVIRSATQRVAVQVDEVLGNREVVVKNLGPQLSRVPGLAGISVLPSGEAALIYNPVALAAIYGDDAVARMQTPIVEPAPAPTAEATPEAARADGGEAATAEAVQTAAPLVMVVDDSITVRRVTQRFLMRNGFVVQLAKDGLDALEQLQQTTTLPDVMLLDIEMPRMDGFDLTRNIRADARLRDLPIIMITSRIADKHRNYAAQLGVNHYLGKPYSESELLDLIREYTAAGARQGTA